MDREIRLFLPLRETIEVAGVRFAGDPAAWLPRGTRKLQDAQPGPGFADLWEVDLSYHALHHRVHLEVYRPEISGHAVTRRIAWVPGPSTSDALRADRLLPSFDGTLELCPGHARSSIIVLDGTYRPPLGSLGDRLDALALHRVAEHTARQLVERIGAKLAIDDREHVDAVSPGLL